MPAYSACAVNARTCICVHVDENGVAMCCEEVEISALHLQGRKYCLDELHLTGMAPD